MHTGSDLNSHIFAKLKMKKYFKVFLVFRIKLVIQFYVGRRITTQELTEFRITRYGFRKSKLKEYPKMVFGILKDKHKALHYYNQDIDEDIKNLARFRCLTLSNIDKITMYGE